MSTDIFLHGDHEVEAGRMSDSHGVHFSLKSVEGPRQGLTVYVGETKSANRLLTALAQAMGYTLTKDNK